MLVFFTILEFNIYYKNQSWGFWIQFKLIFSYNFDQIIFKMTFERGKFYIDNANVSRTGNFNKETTMHEDIFLENI